MTEDQDRDRVSSYRLARHFSVLAKLASGIALDALAHTEEEPHRAPDPLFATMALRSLRLRVEGIAEWVEGPEGLGGAYVGYGRAAPAVDRIMRAMAAKNRVGMVDAPPDDELVEVRVGDIRAILGALVGSR